MPSLTFKKQDFSRFVKTYPFVRREKRLRFVGTKDSVIESGKVTFSNVDEGVYTFTSAFPSAPFVTAASVDTTGKGAASVNVFVDSVTTTQARVKSSAPFTGEVHIHAVYVAP